MSNEIKVGDKVRVREDAPKMYFHDKIGEYIERDSVVVDVEKDNAMIRVGIDFITIPYESVVIPTKYLVKVDAEAKESKFKKGDVVRTVFNETTHITSVLGNGNYYLYGMGNEYPEDSLTLIRPYTEPTELTEAEKTNTRGDTLTFPIAFDLTDSYWDAYAADLAKEIALKVANKYNDPKETAEYAVSVAKAVAEGLKRK